MTVAFVSIGYFEKTDPVKEVSGDTARTAAAVTAEDDIMSTKKIALTFDDDVIIGLSQEISYKEAVSMI